MVGISSCIIVFVFVQYELGFNKFQPSYNRIYRVYSVFKGAEGGTNSGAPTAIKSLTGQIAGVESVCNFHTLKASVNLPSGQQFQDFGLHEKIAIVDSDYFSVFDGYKWIIGNPIKSLSKPFGVVLTESRARTYFGNYNLNEFIGKEIIYNDSLRVFVSGIIEDLERNTDFYFTDFISANTIESSWLKKVIPLESWNSVNSSSQLFIKLKSRINLVDVANQVGNLESIFFRKYKNQWRITLKLQSLSDLHFNSTLGAFDYSLPTIEKSTLYILISISLLILFLAIVNFVNLSTANNINRIKEVGIRKIFGASKERLFTQFLTETVITITLATICSLLLSFVILHYFKEFIPEGFTLDVGNVSFLLFLFTAVITISLLSGLYPSFILSSSQPLNSLKKFYHDSSFPKSNLARKVLVIFQFSFTQILLIILIVVASQNSFLLNKDLGFSSSDIVYFYTPRMEKSSKKKLLKNELNLLTEINSLSNSPPPIAGNLLLNMELNNGKDIVRTLVRQFGADTSFLSLFDIELVAGRNFVESEDTREYLINETYLHEMGFDNPNEVLGRLLDNKYPVVGVVKDFHSKSLHSIVAPCVIFNGEGNYFSIKLEKNEQQIMSRLNRIKVSCNKIYPDNTIEFKFLKDEIKNFYKSEIRSTKLFSTATLISLILSVYGLYSLSAFITLSKRKEISIRKVLGGSVRSIIFLMTWEFMQLFIIAIIIAIPFGYYAVDWWLKDFAYRISIGAWVFILSGLTSIFIGLSAIGFHTIFAARTNPVQFLKSE